jgi:hypothetical protein
MLNPTTSFEYLSSAVVGWYPLVEEICARLDEVDVPIHLKENLISVLRDVDPWIIDKKTIKSWEEILSKMKAPEARLWEIQLRSGASWLSELADRVAEDLTPEMSNWKALKWKIRNRLQK